MLHSKFSLRRTVTGMDIVHPDANCTLVSLNMQALSEPSE
jgi:hypothetical protein